MGEQTEPVINESFKDSFVDDPVRPEFDQEKFYQNEFDYHFLADDVKNRFLEKRLDYDRLEKFGMEKEKRKEYSEKAKEYRERKYGRHGTQERFKNKKYGD